MNRVPIDNRTPEQKQRNQDVILMIIAALHELHRAGLANVKHLPAMTVGGIKRVADLDAGGFKPTDLERRSAMLFLTKQYGIDFRQLHQPTN